MGFAILGFCILAVIVLAYLNAKQREEYRNWVEDEEERLGGDDD